MIDFFSRKKQEILGSQEKTTADISLKDLRARTFLRLMSEAPHDLSDRTLEQVVSTTNTGKTINYQELEQKLPEITQPVFRSFLEGLDLLGISKQLGKSLGEVFKLMRLIERKIQKRSNAAPIQKLRRKGWSKLSPRQQEIAELSLMGFDKYQIATILGGSAETRVNQKSAALAKMGLDAQQFRVLEHSLAQVNIDNLESVFKYRLFNFAFADSEPKQRPELKSVQGQEKAIIILQLYFEGKLTAAEKILLKTFLNTGEYKFATATAGFSEDYGATKIKDIKNDLQNFYDTYLKDQCIEAPSLRINKTKWLLLNALEKDIMLYSLQGFSLKSILEKVKNETSFLALIKTTFRKPLMKSDQVQHLIQRIKEKLDLSDEDINHIKIELLLTKDVDDDDKDLKLTLIKRIFNNKIPRGLGLLGKDRDLKISELFEKILTIASKFLGGARIEDFRLWARGLSAFQIFKHLKDGRAANTIKDQLHNLRRHIKRQLELERLRKAK